MGGRGRHGSEFEASLVYRVSSRAARAIQRNPVSKKTERDIEREREGEREREREREREIEFFQHAFTFTRLFSLTVNLESDYHPLPFSGRETK